METRITTFMSGGAQRLNIFFDNLKKYRLDQDRWTKVTRM